MRGDLTFTFTEETEKKLYEVMYNLDVKNTSRFWVKDKHGYHAMYEKVIHCKDCKWWKENKEECIEWYDSPYAPADGYCFRAERKEE